MGDDSAVTQNVKSNTVTVTINIQCSNGSKFPVQASLESSVESFKSVVEQSCDIPAPHQHLIYRGSTLKDDQTLQSYGIEPEHTVHLVRSFVTTPPAPTVAAGGAPTTTTTTTPPVEVGVPARRNRREPGRVMSRGNGVAELESLYGIEGMMRQISAQPHVGISLDNPDTMRDMIMSTPVMRSQIDRFPSFARRFHDPAIFRQAMELARTPTWSDMEHIRDRAVSVVESSPEGQTHLRVFTTADAGSHALNTNPLPNPWDPAISQIMQGLLTNPQFLDEILGENPQLQSILDSNPQLREMMQNPDLVRQLTSPENMQRALVSILGQQQPNRDLGQTGGATGAPDNMNLDMLMNMLGGLRSGGFTPPNNPNVPPEELYATQLVQLQEMGYNDTRENLQALAATRGNVQAAVECLSGNLGQ